jgi:predicted small secreted protein
MKHLLSLLALVIAAVSLSACNTIKGAGQDVSAVGRDVSAGAQAVQKKL